MGGLLAKTKFEQRKPFYKDAERLITTGFLTHHARIQDTHISFRSLGPGDMSLLRFRTEGHSASDWQQWMASTSIWMVNGFNLLEEPYATPRIFQALGHLPTSSRDILFSLVLGIFARQNRALDAVEVFCYEAHSRYLWKRFRGDPSANNGIPGTSRLGLNIAQQMWVIYNQAEDQRIEDECQWNGFKLVASAMSPKGVKKLDQKDAQSRLNEEERRRAALDKFYYIQMGVLQPPKDGKTHSDDMMVPGPKTTEDLEDEMYRWVTGQDDFHDQVIKDYKRRVSEKYMQEKQEREARAETLRQRLDTDEGSHLLVGYTSDQMADILKDRRPGPPGVKSVPGGQQASRDYLYERYLEKDPDSGLLRPTSGGHLAEASREGLMQEVQNRTVPFKSGKE